MNDTGQYLVLLAVSVGLTVTVGRVLYASGEPFLREVFGDTDLAASVNRLLAVLFQLLTLGVVLLISNADVAADGALQRSVAKLGIVLLVVGGAHAIAMRILLHARKRRHADLRPFPPPAYGNPYAPPCGPAPYPPMAYPQGEYPPAAGPASA